MRIALFIKSTTFHEGYGGLETQNKALCDGLARRGHDVLVFSPQRELKFETKYDKGVKYHFIPSVYRLTRASKKNWFHKSAEAFNKFHQEKKFDLIISQSSAGAGVILRKKEFEVPVVSISHGTIIGELKTLIQSSKAMKDYLRLIRDTFFVLRVFFGRQRRFVHGSDVVVAVSNAVKKSLVEETFVSEDKVEVINNGIDPSKIENANPRSLPGARGDKSVLYVGQIQRSKGVFTLLKLAKELEDEKIGFEVMGGGSDLDELRNQVQKEGLEGQFNLYGKMPYGEVLSAFKSPDVSLFAFPTEREEGFPMVLVESLFAGLPIVSYDVGGVSDAIVDGETGFLVKANKYQKFKQKCLQLLEDETLQEKMGRKAREYAHKNFTLEIMLDRYEKVFKKVTIKK